MSSKLFRGKRQYSASSTGRSSGGGTILRGPRSTAHFIKLDGTTYAVSSKEGTIDLHSVVVLGKAIEASPTGELQIASSVDVRHENDEVLSQFISKFMAISGSIQAENPDDHLAYVRSRIAEAVQ